MLKAIVIYQFMLQVAPGGDITPLFMELAIEAPDHMRDVLRNGSIIVDKSDLTQSGVITLNDLYGLFFNLTTSSKKVHMCEDYIIQTLKESPYKVVSHYYQRGESNKFLLVTFFEATDNVDEYLPALLEMSPRVEKVLSDNLKLYPDGIKFRDAVNDPLKAELKGTALNLERFFSLTKTQKIALIFNSPERLRVLEILRSGPVAVKSLLAELEKVKKSPNLDLILQPFLELNLIRREWAKTTVDRRTHQRFEEGEFLFLVKDVALVRRVPAELLEKIKKDPKIAKIYEKLS